MIQYFKCERCGRQQLKQCRQAPQGIKDSQAKSIGWTEKDGKWTCPFCGEKKDGSKEKKSQAGVEAGQAREPLSRKGKDGKSKKNS